MYYKVDAKFPFFVKKFDNILSWSFKLFTCNLGLLIKIKMTTLNEKDILLFIFYIIIFSMITDNMNNTVVNII